MPWIFGSFLVTRYALTNCHVVISKQGSTIKALRFRQLDVDIGPCLQKVGFSAMEAEKLKLGFWGWTMEDDSWVPAIGE